MTYKKTIWHLPNRVQIKLKLKASLWLFIKDFLSTATNLAVPTQDCYLHTTLQLAKPLRPLKCWMNWLFCSIQVLILTGSNAFPIGQIPIKIRLLPLIQTTENTTKYGPEEEPIITGLIWIGIGCQHSCPSLKRESKLLRNGSPIFWPTITKWVPMLLFSFNPGFPLVSILSLPKWIKN